MRTAFPVPLVIALVAFTASARGQELPRLVYTTDLTVDLTAAGIRRPPAIRAGPGGQVIVAPHPRDSVFLLFDSAGRRLTTTTRVGRARGSDVGSLGESGWLGASVWMADSAFDQIVFLGARGEIRATVAQPAWIRPYWRDRRKYPVFRSIQWVAAYPDTTFLVRPSRANALLKAPEYDRGAQHLVRVTRDGKILRTIARIPEPQNRLLLRDGTERRQFIIPYVSSPSWAASPDGRRIAILHPPTRDSLFTLVVLNADGDTVFVRRHASETRPVTRAMADSALENIAGFARYSTQFIRDTMRRRMPAVMSPLGGVTFGIDESVWVWIFRPTGFEAVVFDPRGNAVGIAELPIAARNGVHSVDRVWNVRTNRDASGPRYELARQRRVDARLARGARTARASAPPARAPSPR